MQLYIELRWNRKVDFDLDYISPGGFEITLTDGTTRRFDFKHTEAGICDSKTQTWFSLKDLDTDYEDGARLTLGDFANIRMINEIFDS